MNEIEKTYSNAGISKKRECEYLDGVCERADFIPCELCAIKRNEIYPPFTAEKQLNLIILLANREIRISPEYMCSGYRLNDMGKVICSRNISTFENSLAQHINAIWQDLTEEEKRQAKEILK